eukprot:m.735245 g.735245  ORF g.735245 m.735245 type:complete len:154 (+) comp58890_c0_seq2:1927-2388(+)
MGGDDEKATGESANAAWVHARGMWLAYLTTVVLAHLLLLSIPVLSTEAVWTLTNVLHAVVTFVVFHWVKGSPTETFDDGATASQTHWEQVWEFFQHPQTLNACFLSKTLSLLDFLSAFSILPCPCAPSPRGFDNPRSLTHRCSGLSAPPDLRS